MHVHVMTQKLSDRYHDRHISIQKYQIFENCVFFLCLVLKNILCVIRFSAGFSQILTSLQNSQNFS